MKSSSITLVSLFAFRTYGSPLFTNSGDLIEKRQSPGSYYAISGASGGIYPRVEVRELERVGGEPWNLFLLAMTEFQAMDQHVIDSWYQIAGMPPTYCSSLIIDTPEGIHGMPW